jgi:hypothetical protein
LQEQQLHMTLHHIAARVQRLERLGLAFAREQLLMRQGDDPLLYLQRLDYLQALQGAVSGLESARVVLARARQRLQR